MKILYIENFPIYGILSVLASNGWTWMCVFCSDKTGLSGMQSIMNDGSGLYKQSKEKLWKHPKRTFAKAILKASWGWIKVPRSSFNTPKTIDKVCKA